MESTQLCDIWTSRSSGIMFLVIEHREVFMDSRHSDTSPPDEICFT
jgi:hypothetical protein